MSEKGEREKKEKEKGGIRGLGRNVCISSTGKLSREGEKKGDNMLDAVEDSRMMKRRQ